MTVAHVYSYCFSDKMVRKYKRRSERGKYGQDNLKAALKAVAEGTPLLRASKEFGIPARTLRRHRDKKVAEPGSINSGRYRCALSLEVEANLRDHVIEMQRRFYGLQFKDIQRLAFDIAEHEGASHPFNKESRMAGEDWVQGFLKRHDLSLRSPQATSISRAVGFNKPQVQRFFYLYKECLNAYNYSPSRL